MAGRRRTGESLAEVARVGDRRATLERLRQELAEAIDAKPEPRDLAALSTRLERVLTDLDELGQRSAGKDSIDDALAARRQARQTATARERPAG